MDQGTPTTSPLNETGNETSAALGDDARDGGSRGGSAFIERASLERIKRDPLAS